ncbi:MAG: FAD-dependent oxidoreductase, partial [Pseudomonadota bacterium]
MDRRGFIAGAAAFPVAASVFGARAEDAARTFAHHHAQPFSAPYAPVRAAPERVVRTVVGLRPYRDQGFVLRAEKVGRRTVVHNYGHGGCGITLSLGCAEMAADAAAAASDERRAVVLGAGVIGLTTAMALLRRGYQVTIYGESLPPYTTSNIAAGFWHPATLFSRAAIDDAFIAQFRQAARLSHRRFQHLVNDPYYGVRWIRYFDLHDEIREQPTPPAVEGNDLYPNIADERNPERYFGFAQVHRFHALMIDTDIFLRALVRDIDRAGGRIVQQRFETQGDLFDRREKLFFNCAGLGARALFGDEALGPVRGQLTYLLPQPEVD